MAPWITIAEGIIVGLLWRRVAASHPLGVVTDVLLSLCGAFAGRLLVDVLSRIGVNVESYGWAFVLCGAVLLSWTFHGFGSPHNQIRKPHHTSVSELVAPISKPETGSQEDSTKARPAA